MTDQTQTKQPSEFPQTPEALLDDLIKLCEEHPTWRNPQINGECVYNADHSFPLVVGTDAVESPHCIVGQQLTNYGITVGDEWNEQTTAETVLWNLRDKGTIQVVDEVARLATFVQTIADGAAPSWIDVSSAYDPRPWGEVQKIIEENRTVLLERA